MRRIPAPFAAAEGTSGTAAACGDEEVGTGLSLAVLLPEAVTTAVVVDGIRVDYRLDGEKHTTIADARLGSCAMAPAEPTVEPQECHRERP